MKSRTEPPVDARRFLRRGNGLLIAAVIVGFVLLLAGAAAVFVSSNSGGTAALLGAGAALVAIGIWGDRLETFEGAGFKLGLHAAADLVAAEANRAEIEGDPVRAAELRQQADQLFDGASHFASEYESVRRSMSRGIDRSRLMSSVVERARRELAAREYATPESIAHLFSEGSEGNRMIALAVIQSDGRLGSSAILMSAVENPRSAFEQWNALAALRATIAAKALLPVEIQSVRALLAAKMKTTLLGDEGSDRRKIAQSLLDELGSR